MTRTGRCALALACVLISIGTAAAQGLLKIMVLEGDGALNNIRRRTARKPVIEVRDEENRVVSGASVVFTLPSTGPGGTFEGGAKSFATTTDAQGRATTLPLMPNSIEGRFLIRVSAHAAEREGAAVIAQSNTLAGGSMVAGPPRRSRKKLALIILASGGAAVAIAVARGGGSSSSPSTTIGFGSITIGGPR